MLPLGLRWVPINLGVTDVAAFLGGRRTQLRRVQGGQADRWCRDDRLWVREPYHLLERYGHRSPLQTLAHDPSTPCHYAADGEPPQGYGRRRFAREMPRVLSRFALRVRARRVELLQQITEDDARAEGFTASATGNARDAFAAAWDAGPALSIAALGGSRVPLGVSWAMNPRVVVVDVEIERAVAGGERSRLEAAMDRLEARA